MDQQCVQLIPCVCESLEKKAKMDEQESRA